MSFNLNASLLSGTTTAQRQAWLLEAQTSYALLTSGGKPVTVSYEGKSVSYSTATSAGLLSWIGLLQASLGVGRPRRAIRPYFR